MSDDLLTTLLKPRANDAPVGLSLGAMNFGKRTNEAESKSVLARSVELGVIHIDTANGYNDGASERIVGGFIKNGRLRDKVVLATKVGFGRVAGKPEGLGRDSMLRACDESLARLGTDYVDLYYLHVPDRATPIEESLEAIAVLLETKKIRAWGVSNYGAWQILEMMHLADASAAAATNGANGAYAKLHGLPRPAVAQQLYNVLIRQLDVEYFAFARKYGLHTTIFNPLAGGLLTGKHTRDGSTQKGSRFDRNRLYQGRYFTESMFDRVEQLTDVARTENISLLELSYAWAAGAPGVDSILLGPASVTQLDEGVAACKKVLSPDTRKRIDELHREWLGTDTYYVR